MSVCLILVAAGRGRRFGPPSQRPKQFKPLLGKPLLYWPLRTFENTPSVKHVVVVASRDYVPWVERFVRRVRFQKVFAVVEGGAERADSVRRGFRAVPGGTRIVLIHDAARPLVTRRIVERVVQGARRTGAALAACPVPDTLKSADAQGRVRRTIPRKDLWLAQTPQGFRVSVAEKVIWRKGPPPTDDVQWAERAGRPVELVPGSPMNFKVTVPDDFKICEALMRSKGFR